MAAAPPSPASSPRLPSPPPIAEDQLGPQSPVPTDEHQKLLLSLDHGAARRIRPGTKAEDMAEGPPLLELAEIDSAFQLTEHLKALHYALTHAHGADTTVAVDREMALKMAEPPENVDRTLWLYELCRFLTQKVNAIITALFSDDPPCSSATCPEMRASEWQYLCAVHDPPKACCAIDYCCHTLDWAANSLTSTKTFPSRLALDTNQSNQHQQIRLLTNIFRRVYRIFAHAWFQHRDMFWKVEGRTGLYILFKTIADGYGLIPEDNYTIPPEAEGLDASQAAPPQILRREPSGPASQEHENPIVEGVTDHTLSTAGTTKRHRHSPSVGANSVHTVVEENEEEPDAASKHSSGASPRSAETIEENKEATGPVEEPAPAEEASDAPAPNGGVSEESPADPVGEADEQSEPSLTPDSSPKLEEKKELEAENNPMEEEQAEEKKAEDAKEDDKAEAADQSGEHEEQKAETESDSEEKAATEAKPADEFLPLTAETGKSGKEQGEGEAAESSEPTDSAEKAKSDD